MSSYTLLEPRGSAVRCIAAQHGRHEELGLFLFNDKPVTICRVGDRTLRAHREGATCRIPGLEAVLRLLNRLFGCRLGTTWDLNEREKADVKRALQVPESTSGSGSAVPGARSAIDSATGCTADSATAADAASRSPPAPTIQALVCATPALQAVLELLDPESRISLGKYCSAMQRPFEQAWTSRSLDIALYQASQVRTLRQLEELTARYGLDGPQKADGMSRASLSETQCRQLLGALAERLAVLPRGTFAAAAKHLVAIALGQGGSALVTLLTRVPPALRSTLALDLNEHVILNLVNSLESDLQPEALVTLMELHVYMPNRLTPIERWEGLYAAATDPSPPRLAHLAALARALCKYPDTLPWSAFSVWDAERWERLVKHLPSTPQQGYPLAMALAEGMSNVALLDVVVPRAPQGQRPRVNTAALHDWAVGARAHGSAEAGGLTPAQEARLSVALFSYCLEEGAPGLAAQWEAVWRHVVKHRLTNHAAAAIDALDRLAPLQRRRYVDDVIQYIGSNEAPATWGQRAEMLAALIAVIDRPRSGTPSEVKEPCAVRGALEELSLWVLRQGGSVAPLLRCQWLTEDQILAAIDKHISWPEKAEALAEWCESLGTSRNRAPMTPAELRALEPMIAQIGDQLQRGASGATRNACMHVLRNAALWADGWAQDGHHLAESLTLAPVLLAALQQTRHDDIATALASMAQWCNTLILKLQEQRPDDADASARVQALLAAIWSHAERMKPAGREGMLQALIELKARIPARDARIAHYWADTFLSCAVKAIPADMPNARTLLERLARVDVRVRPPAHSWDTGGDAWPPSRVDVVSKVMELPDDASRRLEMDLLRELSEVGPGPVDRGRMKRMIRQRLTALSRPR